MMSLTRNAKTFNIWWFDKSIYNDEFNEKVEWNDKFICHLMDKTFTFNRFEVQSSLNFLEFNALQEKMIELYILL